jgi:ABC-type glycerol-3-phosphate transport system substrate-binding protein
MMTHLIRITLCISVLFLAGCSSLAPLLARLTPSPVTVIPSPEQTQTQATSTPEAEVTETARPATEPRILRVWLPPQFDPNAGTVPANLLKERLAAFEAQHPGLEIEVRVKSEEGEANILNALSVTSMAAPSALPDLVALSRPALETAALKGLLHPIDGLSTTLQDPNWYGYAQQLAQVENIDYGLPFAGNVLSLFYRAELGEFTNWEEILASEALLSFSAGDPQGLVGLSLYSSGGGEIVNAQGLPTLDREVLTRLLTLIQDGLGASMLSPSLAIVGTDAQALQLYRDRNASMVITWASNYRPVSDEQIVPLLGLDETPYSFSTGWMWALAGSDTEKQALAVELAEYLVADEFIGEWTRESGYLPTRPSSVDEEDPILTALIESAQPLPSNEVLSVLGQLMQDALIRVLNGEQPEDVAASVVETLQ